MSSSSGVSVVASETVMSGRGEVYNGRGEVYNGRGGIYWLRKADYIGQGGFSRISRVAVSSFVGNSGDGASPTTVIGRQLVLNTQESWAKKAKDVRLQNSAWRVQRLMPDWEHPHVITVYDVLTKDGSNNLFLLMEKHGVDLKLYMRSRSFQTAVSGQNGSIVLDMMEQTAAAVAYIHNKGVVHRDLRPANWTIVETDHGPHIKLIDFSLSVGKDSSGNYERHLLAGAKSCKPPWIQDGDLQAADPIDEIPVTEREDVFGLGMTWIEIFRWASGAREEHEYNGGWGDEWFLPRFVDAAPDKYQDLVRRLITPEEPRRLADGSEVVTALKQRKRYKEVIGAIRSVEWITFVSMQPAPRDRSDLNQTSFAFVEGGLEHAVILFSADGSRREWRVDWSSNIPSYNQLMQEVLADVNEPVPGILTLEERSVALLDDPEFDGSETRASILDMTDPAVVGRAGYTIFELLGQRFCCGFACGTFSYTGANKRFVLLAHRPEHRPERGRREGDLYAYQIRIGKDGYRVRETGPGKTIAEIALELGVAPAPAASDATDSRDGSSS